MILSGGRSAPIRLALKEAPGRLGCCATIRVNTFPILIVATTSTSTALADWRVRPQWILAMA